MAEEESQAISTVSAPLEAEKNKPIIQQSVVPSQRTYQRKALVPRFPVREERAPAALLSIGHYRPSTPKGRPREQGQSQVYSQIGKWPAPRSLPSRRPVDRVERRVTLATGPVELDVD